MNTPAATGALAWLTDARTDWLNQALEVFSSHRFVEAVWAEGSLARGDADAFSDVDLVLAIGGSASPSVFADPIAGLGLPGRVLYTRDKPKNAPTGDAYRAACVELAALPVLVDLYLWPAATATMSATARLLFHRGDRPPRSHLSFLPLISRYPSGDARDSDPYQPQTVLMLVQLRRNTLPAAMTSGKPPSAACCAIRQAPATPPRYGACLLPGSTRWRTRRWRQRSQPCTG